MNHNTIDVAMIWDRGLNWGYARFYGWLLTSSISLCSHHLWGIEVYFVLGAETMDTFLIFKKSSRLDCVYLKFSLFFHLDIQFPLFLKWDFCIAKISPSTFNRKWKFKLKLKWKLKVNFLDKYKVVQNTTLE